MGSGTRILGDNAPRGLCFRQRGRKVGSDSEQEKTKVGREGETPLKGQRRTFLDGGLKNTDAIPALKDDAKSEKKAYAEARWQEKPGSWRGRELEGLPVKLDGGGLH